MATLVYTHQEIDDVLDYLTKQELSYGAIPQVSRDPGIACEVLRDWRGKRIEEGGGN